MNQQYTRVRRNSLALEQKNKKIKIQHHGQRRKMAVYLSQAMHLPSPGVGQEQWHEVVVVEGDRSVKQHNTVMGASESCQAAMNSENSVSDKPHSCSLYEDTWNAVLQLSEPGPSCFSHLLRDAKQCRGAYAGLIPCPRRALVSRQTKTVGQWLDSPSSGNGRAGSRK